MVLFALSVVGLGEDEGDDLYERSFDPSDSQYRVDGCVGCKSAFDFIDSQLQKPYAGQSDAMLEAQIIDANPCQWAVGSTQAKCYTVIETLEDEGALLSYIHKRTPSAEGRAQHCERWCK